MRAWIRLCLLPALIFSLPAFSQTVSDSTKQGYAQLQKGDCKAAYGSFAASLTADARDGAAAFGRAMAFQCALKFKEAAQAFAGYEKAGGKNPALDHQYGVALVRTGQAAQAIPRLTRARQADPKSAPVVDLSLGLAYAASGRYDEAERTLKEASASKETRPTALLYLAGMERKRGNDAASAAYLETLQKDAPDSPAAKAVASLAPKLAKKN